MTANPLCAVFPRGVGLAPSYRPRHPETTVLYKALERDFEALRASTLKTARAWAIKDLAMTLWGYTCRRPAERAWKKWLAWALRCRLDPVRKVAKTIRSHLWGILNAIVHDVTNAEAEVINSRIPWLKRRACGYRNRKRFRNAIYFHQGGLDLHPRPRTAHTIV